MPRPEKFCGPSTVVAQLSTGLPLSTDFSSGDPVTAVSGPASVITRCTPLPLPSRATTSMTNDFPGCWQSQEYKTRRYKYENDVPGCCRRSSDLHGCSGRRSQC